MKDKNTGCPYCRENKSLIVDEKNYIKEVYLELDSTLTIETTIYDDDYEFPLPHSVNFSINFCPKCGAKLTKKSS